MTDGKHDHRIWVGERKLRHTGGSTSLSFPNFLLENIDLDIEEAALIYADPDTNEIIVSTNPESLNDGQELLGSRKARKIGGSLAVTIPPEISDYIDVDKGQEVDVYINSETRNIIASF